MQATSALYFLSLPKKHRLQAQLNGLVRGSTIMIPRSFLADSQVRGLIGLGIYVLYVCMYGMIHACIHKFTTLYTFVLTTSMQVYSMYVCMYLT